MRILLVEDEPDIAEPVLEILRRDHHDVTWSSEAEDAFSHVAETAYDLAILDVMLPSGADAGFRLALALRGAGYDGHILFLTARDAVADRVAGLDAGGDDYLVKPFSLLELAARVRALLRRTAETKTSLLERPPLRVDLSGRRVTWEGRPIDLSDREFAIVELFAHYPERIFAADELVERFFPSAASGTRVVRVYVSQLRRKIADDVVVTVPGGYRLGPA
jgi:two-component system, OmpR family, response regulator QseB